MQKARGTWTEYFIALLVAAMAACIAAYFYSREKGIPDRVAWAVLPAFLLELAFYMAPGFGAVRRALSRLPAAILALAITVSAVVPYMAATLWLGTFRFSSLLILCALAALVAFWYVALKPGLIVDLVFLGVAAAVFLSPLFRTIYPDPSRGLPLLTLGRLMWIHVSVTSVLLIRRIEAGFGFTPTAQEWRIGVTLFLCFMPVGVLLGYVLRFARFHPVAVVWWKMPFLALGTFLGAMWVLALAEEFFFRGFLQQILARTFSSDAAGLIVASLVFGAAHLPFRHFPNWQLAILAAAAGVFYGLGFAKTRGIRASMVTHALVVTAWKLLFA